MSKKWTAKNLSVLEKYVAFHSARLVSDLHKNILVGSVRFSKPYGFFSGMAKLLAKSPAQCKSRFLRMEPALYLDVLGVSPSDFWLFANIRRQKKEKRRLQSDFPDFEQIDILSQKGKGRSADEAESQVQDPEQSQASGLLQVGSGGFYEMSRGEIKRKRLKLMSLFLERKLSLIFKSKGGPKARIN